MKLEMSKSIFVVTIVGVIALARIMSTVVTADVFADSKRDRANKVLDKAGEIKDRLNGGGSGNPHT
jgi:hypothetical protein